MSDGPIDPVKFEAFRKAVQDSVPDEVASILMFVFLEDGQIGMLVYGDADTVTKTTIDLNTLRDNFVFERKPN